MSFSPIDILLFLLGMGFTETIVKPLMRTVFRKAYSVLLPKMFERLDPILPESITKMLPRDVEKRIYGAIDGCAKEEGIALNEADRKELYEEFIRLYNPVIAASKN